MDIQITFHQMSPSEEIKRYCEKKIGGEARYFERILNAKIVLEVAKLEHIVKVVLTMPKKTVITAEARESNMYASIDKVVEKLKRQVVDFKEQQ